MVNDSNEMMSRRRLLQVASGTGVAGGVGLIGSAVGNESTYDGDPYSDPEYPSDEWFAREQSNWQKTREEPIRQANDPGFMKRWREQAEINYVNYRQRTTLEETEWDRNGLCESWREQCTGDPYMYPAHEPVWSGDPFYEETGDVERVVFYDSEEDAARLNGRVWAPKDAEPEDDLPGVVIMNGGAATETMYWWFAQSLLENGYVAMTFDPVGQGKSEDSDAGAADHQIDALDFFVSTPSSPYPNNPEKGRDDEDAVPVREYNPFHDLLDKDRVGTAGHSMGASSTSSVQGLDPWPGVSDENPVKVAVTWDGLNPAGSERDGYTVEPQVPVMDQRADYRNEEVSSWIPEPKSEPPDPDERKQAFDSWVENGVPAFVFTTRGTTHFEWSRVPSFPATSWESWGNEMADFFSIAWFDFWLKERGEPGYDDAEYRLLRIDDDPWEDRLSFYYNSAYHFPSNPDAGNWPTKGSDNRPGNWHYCEDIVDGDC